jgi:hypothetical protein
VRKEDLPGSRVGLNQVEYARCVMLIVKSK